MKNARSLFSWVLAMTLLIASVAVPSTSEAAYKKRVLPNACAGATEKPFWEGKIVPNSGDKKLFFVTMGALDTTVGGEYEVAVAKWNSLCDQQRKIYKTRLEGVVRTAVYVVLDYRFSGPEVFGGTSYPDSDGENEELEAMDIDVIGDLLMKSLSELTVLDLVAAARPGTPHSSGTLAGFTAEVCRQTGVDCPKKAPAKVSTGSGTGTKASAPPAQPAQPPAP